MKKEFILDKYFENKTFKDILLIFLMIAGIISFFIFYFLFPYIYNLEKKEKTTLSNNIKKVKELKIKKNAYNAQTKALTKKILKTNKKNKILANKNMFYQDLLNTINVIVFKEKNWINYIQQMVNDANKKNLKILSIQTIYSDNSKQNTPIVKKMEIKLNMKGNFLNFISYIYDYENNKNLLKIEDFNISDKNRYFLKFSIYGEKK